MICSIVALLATNVAPFWLELLPQRSATKHYAANILDYSDEITRRSLPSFGPSSQPADFKLQIVPPAPSNRR